MYEIMVEVLCRTNSDFCVSNYNSVFEDGRVEFNSTSDVEIIMTNKEIWRHLNVKLPDGIGMTTYLWEKLFRKELFQNIHFRKGSNWDDAFAIHDILNANPQITASVITDAFYSYYVRENSTSHSLCGARDLDIAEERVVRAKRLCDYACYKEAESALFAGIGHLATRQRQKKDIEIKQKIRKLRKEIILTYRFLPKEGVSVKHKISIAIFYLSMNLYYFFLSMK